MSSDATNLWTIDELNAQVVLALSVDYEGQENGQVREVPDLRTIRYYTSIGLLDRPAAMRARTAYYGHRHLLQLVAIKRLQAKSKSLADIQQHLLGLSDSELASLAQLPTSSDTTEIPERRSATFWLDSSAPVSKREPAVSPTGSSLQNVPLTDEVELRFRPARPLEPDDIEAIQCAAAPLLKLLEKRRLS